MARLQSSDLIEVVDRILEEDELTEWITFDRDLAEKKNILALSWARSGVAVPTTFDVTEAKLKKSPLNFRELRRRIREFSPDYILKALASEGQTRLRNSNRRNLVAAEKEIDGWIKKCISSLEQVLGYDAAKKFESVFEGQTYEQSIRGMTQKVELAVDKLFHL